MRNLDRAQAYLEAHVEADLDGTRLSEVAGLSKFHFHRQFTKAFGISARDYVEQVRLRRAGFRLAFRPHDPILAIALDSGFTSHAAFTRAFKRVTGQTPSEFRQAPAWDTWATLARPLNEARRRRSARGPWRTAVEVVDRPELRVVGVRHRPDDGPLMTTAQRFIAWRRQHRLSPRTHPTFNLLRHDRRSFAFAVGTTRRVPLEVGMFVGAVPGGQCAVLRHVGDEESLRTAIRWLAVDWCAATGARPRGDELALQRRTLFPDVPERAATTDIIVPLG